MHRGRLPFVEPACVMMLTYRVTFPVPTLIGVVNMVVYDADGVSFETGVAAPLRQDLYMIDHKMYVAELTPDIVAKDASKSLFVTGLARKYQLSHAVAKKLVTPADEYYVTICGSYAMTNHLNIWNLRTGECVQCESTDFPQYMRDAIYARFKEVAPMGSFAHVCRMMSQLVDSYLTETDTLKSAVDVCAKHVALHDAQLVDLKTQNINLDRQLKRYERACRGPLRLTHKMKMNVWTTHFGQQMWGSCAACDKAINITRFDCSHVIARCLGGAATLANLAPCCRDCNNRMGPMDLDVYREKLLKKPPRVKPWVQ